MWIRKTLSLRGDTMKLTWEYSLPTNEKSMEYHYEGPILAGDDYVYFGSKFIRNIYLHTINVHTGQGTTLEFPQSDFLWLSPRNFFGFFHKGLAYYYAADLYVLKDDQLIATVPLSEYRDFNSWLLRDDRLYLAIGHRPVETLLCIDLNSLEILWTQEIGCTKNYRAGAISFFEQYITCYGHDQLLFINPEDGIIEKQLRFPRIDKLFCPIRQEDGSLLIGYTNWTNAGILRYDEASQKIRWRYKRKFEGPLGHCRIYPCENNVYWAKNDTELICLDRSSGQEIDRIRTAPWRYTGFRFENGNLLFGTSGADGYLYCLDASTCKVLWTLPLKEGCSYFDVLDNFAYTGDFSKQIFRIAISDGSITEALPVDAEVIGDIKIRNQKLYAVLWGNSEKPIRLVQIDLS